MTEDDSPPSATAEVVGRRVAPVRPAYVNWSVDLHLTEDVTNIGDVLDQLDGGSDEHHVWALG
jgi:hypothetical protein